MKKTLLIGASLVVLTAAGTFALSQNAQKVEAQTTTSSFNQELSAMTQAMKAGNFAGAKADYTQAQNAMAHISSKKLQNTNWISQMTKIMSENQNTLSAMMTNKTALSAMTTAMKAGQTVNASTDYKNAVNAMTTIMQNANLKNSTWVNQMTQAMTTYHSQLGSMMTGTTASNATTYSNMMSGRTTGTASTYSNMMNDTYTSGATSNATSNYNSMMGNK
ncbi:MULTISPECIES: hypothetical protein [unclassified Lactococcus]|uniref:hypothetical protein n=1 Tax=unclassified Lactococcus TaxID=2643510 RepID=UPI0011C85999|nr:MULTISPECIES: hypothetical protein [unclassified Lactococcus]MQW23078.1 hypothetical protein [Lactococcus sp. dk101]TXK44423.1 hypothetical protein FVP42_05595 [Lactococcus sp. dk310]TXK50233.1 hypothetical protein FVP43_05565 [Lactococcus sp. dk322]